MASVFLSYDHEDAASAVPIVSALEKAGHIVWWDRHIHGGAEFDKEIEEAVERAAAVVVLWSQRSVRSAWVRDEAAEGRDRGKLVPVTIDGTKPPMGFRQYQTVDLSGRKRSGNMAELLRALSNVSQGDAAQPVPVASARARLRPPSLDWRVTVVAALLILGGAAFFMWRSSNRSPVPIVAVVAGERSPHAEAVARDLLVKLGSMQSAKANAMRLVGADSSARRDADFILEASGTGSPRLLKANLALLAGKDRTLLWSKDFQPEGNSGNVDQQLAFTGGQVVDCAREASGPHQGRIDQDTLKLFLNGCALFGEKYRTDPEAIIPIFGQIVERAPTLEPAWRKLLLAESLYTRTERLLHRYTPGSLPEHIAAARKLNPDIPEIYLAESTLVPLHHFALRSELLDRAIGLDAQNPDLLLMRAEFYAGVGRMADSVQDASRAVQLNPLSPGLLSHLIADLVYAGRLEFARQELARAEEQWPDSAAIQDARFRFHNRYGDAKVALEMYRSGALRLQPMVTPMLESFLLARIDPTEANVERAMTEAKKRLSADARAFGDLIQTAGEFHREEQLYGVLLNSPAAEVRAGLGEALFRPSLARFRQDPRFMRVAARAALVDYWQKSGKWPDFCFEPDLPYDCKVEAAKLK